MRTIAATIDIDAPPMDVWAVLTDLSRYPEWNPHIREGAGEVTAGGRLTLRMFPPRGGPVTIRPMVLVAEPAADWRLLGGLPGIFGRLIFSGEHRFALTAAGGGTRLVQSEAFRGILVPFIGKTLAGAQASFQKQNEALKKRVETTSSAGQDDLTTLARSMPRAAGRIAMPGRTCGKDRRQH